MAHTHLKYANLQKFQYSKCHEYCSKTLREAFFSVLCYTQPFALFSHWLSSTKTVCAQQNQHFLFQHYFKTTEANKISFPSQGQVVFSWVPALFCRVLLWLNGRWAERNSLSQSNTLSFESGPTQRQRELSNRSNGYLGSFCLGN